MSKKLKNIELVVEDLRGVCVWELADGSVIGDEEDRLLSMEGELYSPIIERKMRDAARHYLGEEALLGRARWIPGSRKITDNESDDHMERMLDGAIPDPVDAVKQLQRRGLA